MLPTCQLKFSIFSTAANRRRQASGPPRGQALQRDQGEAAQKEGEAATEGAASTAGDPAEEGQGDYGARPQGERCESGYCSFLEDEKFLLFSINSYHIVTIQNQQKVRAALLICQIQDGVMSYIAVV